jgi:molybdopterin synthase sulfur carrier subunit
VIRVLFFASLREQLDCAALELQAEGITSLAALREQLSRRGESWRRALSDSNLQMALNQQLVEPCSSVNSGDEVAFFPPVTGG